MWTDGDDYESINPPIRGSIASNHIIWLEEDFVFKKLCINPPIRGSIEQDNALFENYNHKR